MIEKLMSSTATGDVIIGRDTDTGTLIISCIDGVVIEVPPEGEISVDESGHGHICGLTFLSGVPDSPPPWFGYAQD